MGKGIPIHVLGTSFTIQTDESPEYVQQLVKYVSSKIDGLTKTVSTKDSIRIAVLAAILIADELFKEREAAGGGAGGSSPRAVPGAVPEDELEHLADHMIARLDSVLDGPAGSDS